MSIKDWYLVRPGVRLAGTWGPDIFDYPFRYEGPKIGDEVYVIVRNRNTKEFLIARDTIIDIYDHGAQREDKEDCLIDYTIKDYDPGFGLSFGETLFETAEDAAEVLLDIEANLDKWDGNRYE